MSAFQRCPVSKRPTSVYVPNAVGQQIGPGYWVYPANWTDEQCREWAAEYWTLRRLCGERNARNGETIETLRRRAALHAANVARCAQLARLEDAAFRGRCPEFCQDIYGQSFRRELSERQLAAVAKIVDQRDGGARGPSGGER